MRHGTADYKVPGSTLGKPFTISETGASGIYEWDRNTTDVKWSLKYQSEIIGGDVSRTNIQAFPFSYVERTVWNKRR